MKKIILLLSISSFLQSEAKSQITKGNWMVGGNASFVFNNAYSGSTNTRTTTLNLAPDIGYFFIDKLAGGIKASFYNNHIQFGAPNDNYSTFTIYSIGPSVRYYLLPEDNMYNILGEISYLFSNQKIRTNIPPVSNTNLNNFSISAGPVIYFNSSVGLEFLLNYVSGGNSFSSKRSNSFGAGIGLQIHLERDK